MQVLVKKLKAPKRELLKLVSVLFETCFHSHVVIKDLFTDSDVFGSYFKKFVIFKELDGSFKAHSLIRNKTESIVGTGCTGVGKMFGFANVNCNIFCFRRRTDNHSFVTGTPGPIKS